MAKLILSMDSLVLKEIPLTKERVSIGRKPHNDIQIDNLAISGDHAVITTLLKDSFIEDLDSTNGTLINGKPIRRHALQPNDVIEMGKYSLKYIADTPKTDNIEPDKDQVVVVWSNTQNSPQTSPPPFKLSGDTHVGYSDNINKEEAIVQDIPLAAIKLLNGQNAGKGMDLAKSRSTLGRAGSQVIAILRERDGYFLEHVEGHELPMINQQKITNKRYLLKHKDVIEVAGTSMEFYYK